jgi:hypothetical protein
MAWAGASYGPIHDFCELGITTLTSQPTLRALVSLYTTGWVKQKPTESPGKVLIQAENIWRIGAGRAIIILYIMFISPPEIEQ